MTKSPLRGNRSQPHGPGQDRRQTQSVDRSPGHSGGGWRWLGPTAATRSWCGLRWTASPGRVRRPARTRTRRVRSRVRPCAPIRSSNEAVLVRPWVCAWTRATTSGGSDPARVWLHRPHPTRSENMRRRTLYGSTGPAKPHLYPPRGDPAVLGRGGPGHRQLQSPALGGGTDSQLDEPFSAHLGPLGQVSGHTLSSFRLCPYHPQNGLKWGVS